MLRNAAGHAPETETSLWGVLRFRGQEVGVLTHASLLRVLDKVLGL